MKYVREGFWYGVVFRGVVEERRGEVERVGLYTTSTSTSASASRSAPMLSFGRAETQGTSGFSLSSFLLLISGRRWFFGMLAQ